jgi:hypothetical protein
MTYDRLPYDDAASPSEMVSDATKVGRELHLPLQTPLPTLSGFDPELEDAPRTPSFGTVEVSDSLAQMAAGLELHFD